MSLTADDLIKLMEKAKELGITQIKAEGTEISFAAPEPPKPEAREFEPMTEKELRRPLEFYDEVLSDSELLQYLAVPYFDELWAKKQATKAQREEEDKQRQT